MWECVSGLVVKVEDSLQGAIIEDKNLMILWLFEYDREVDLSNNTTDEVAQGT